MSKTAHQHLKNKGADWKLDSFQTAFDSNRYNAKMQQAYPAAGLFWQGCFEGVKAENAWL